MKNIQALQEKIIDIAESPIAPHGEFYMGMNFREYLIGQALTNFPNPRIRDVEDNAKAVLALVNAIIREMAKEYLEAEAEEQEQKNVGDTKTT